VAELQTHLAQLGFNPGRIDGIFGPLLEVAVADFQRNRALEPHGVLDRATLVELRRLSAFAGDRHLVTEARDLAALEDPALGPLVVCGTGPLAAALAHRAAGPFEVRRVEDSAPEVCAEVANRLEAALVVAVASDARLVGVRLTYWASYRAHSARGERLATAVADALARRVGERCEVAGMALPLLRETRMTTLLVEHGPLEDRILEGVAETLARVAARVFHRNG
jgi:N-acetylmuramoyl-L-alanine amidase